MLIYRTGFREYHVQFFGDATERGWIPTVNLLDFQGREQFDKYVEEVFSKAKNSTDLKVLKKKYSVPPYRKNAVDKGIAQAEEAMALDRNERKAQYTFVYQIPKSKQAAETKDIGEDLRIIQGSEEKPSDKKPAKKRKHEEVASPDASKSGAKKRKVDTTNSAAETPTKPDSPAKGKSSTKKPSVQKLRLETEGSFEVFCQKERENVLQEHPEFTDDMLMDYCRQQWCMMSKKQKVRYKSKYSEDTGTGKSCRGEAYNVEDGKTVVCR